MAILPKAPKRLGKGDRLEFDEAVDYLVRRFEGRGVTLSTRGPVIRVSVGAPGDPEYRVWKARRGWVVMRGRRVIDAGARSYERVAVLVEEDSGLVIPDDVFPF